MKTHHDHSTDMTDDTLSLAARKAHAQALDHVSARVQAQLAQRRHAAVRQSRRAYTQWLPAFALGGAAALVLAIGLRMQLATPDADASQGNPTAVIAHPANTTGPDPVVTENIHASSSDDAEIVASAASSTDTLAVVANDDDLFFDPLEETPDFYLWLASEDAADFAVESL